MNRDEVNSLRHDEIDDGQIRKPANSQTAVGTESPSAASLRSAATDLKVERLQKDRTLIFADLHSSESAKISVNQRSKFFAPGEETKR